MSASECPALRYLLYFCPGIIAGMYLGVPLIWAAFLLFLVIVFILVLNKKHHVTYLFAICIVLSGMLRVSLSEKAYGLNHQIPEGHSQADIQVIKQKTNPFYIESYIIKTTLNDRPIKGTLYARKGMPVLFPGKKYCISDLKWERITQDPNPYVFNYLAYAKTKGMTHKFSLGKDAEIKDIGIGNAILFLSSKVRNDISIRFLSVLGIEKGSLVNGLLLGLKSEIPACIADLFRQLGVSHLLAVSGLHVGLITLILYQVLLTLSIPRIPRVFLITGFLIFYCFLTGGSPSVIRSSLMSVMLIISPVLKRRYVALNAVAASAVILLLVNPFMIRDLGFQFSYTAVFGILMAYPKIRKQLPVKNLNNIWKYVLDMISVSLSAALFTAPVALFYFNSVQLASMFLNLLVIPLTFCVMICSLLSLPGLYIHTFLSDLVVHALDLSLDIFIDVLRLASLSEVWTLHASSYYKALIMAAFLICIILLIASKRKIRIILISLTIAICLSWFYFTSRPQLIQLDLKKGRALLVRHKRSALIVNTGAKYFSYNDHERYIQPVLDQWGINNVTVVVTSWEKGYNSNLGAIRRKYSQCPVFIPVTDENIEQNYKMTDHDTLLVNQGMSVKITPDNDFLSIKIKLGRENFEFDHDTLSINPLCEYPKHYVLLHKLKDKTE